MGTLIYFNGMVSHKFTYLIIHTPYNLIDTKKLSIILVKQIYFGNHTLRSFSGCSLFLFCKGTLYENTVAVVVT